MTATKAGVPPGAGRRVAPAATTPPAENPTIPTRSGDTPRSARYLAASVPSLVMERAMKPPPGQIMAAVPFLVAAEGLKTISEGLVTFVTTSVFQSFEK